MAYLPEMDLVTLSQNIQSENEGQFIIEPLLPGFGMTLGNTLRRVLLSSLKGAAITAVKLNDATHEFTTIDGATEDIVAIILNLKGVRLNYEGTEPVTITLSVKGPQVVKAGDFKAPAGVEIINKDHIVAHIDKGATLTIEALVENGKGYLPTEQRKDHVLPVGMISIDAIFSPIKKIHHEVTNTRVGQATDFDTLTLDITTDGSLSASAALKQSINILTEYFTLIGSSINLASEKPKTVSKKKAKTAETEAPVEAPTEGTE
jgi:DNA-directed RNA polymerase subunit alpha